MAGCVEGIHRVLVLGLVLKAGSAIEQPPSVGPQYYVIVCSIQVLLEKCSYLQ